MINRVRNTVLSVLNKENQGYITPVQYNYYAKQAQTEIFVEIFKEYSDTVNKRNRGLVRTGHSNKLRQLETVIAIFSTESPLTYSVVTELFSKPSDVFDPSVLYLEATGVHIDLVSNLEAKRLNRTLDCAPSLTYPIGVDMDGGYKIYPDTITAGVTMNYVRYPTDPNWTYLGLSGGEPLFNQSATDYQDFELPDRYEYDLCVRILKLCGVEISKDEIVQFTKAEEIQKKQENASQWLT